MSGDSVISSGRLRSDVPGIRPRPRCVSYFPGRLRSDVPGIRPRPRCVSYDVLPFVVGWRRCRRCLWRHGREREGVDVVTEHQPEGGTLPLDRLDGDITAVGLCHVANDRESEAGAAGVATAGVIDPIEALEDPLVIAGG